MNKGLVTVFGGAGFVGKHVVRSLVKAGWRVRVPMRRPHTGQDLRVIGNVGQVQLVQANLRFKESVSRAVAGSDAIINLAGICYEEGRQSFQSVHVTGAEFIAEAAMEHNIVNMVHMSALGADVESESKYEKTKAEGDAAVQALIPSADIMRPSLIFGPEDHFFNRVAAYSQMSPVLPVIGWGKTKFQPAYAGDVAEDGVTVINQGTTGRVYELGGPGVYSLEELMQLTLRVVDRKRLLLPVPWFISGPLGLMGEIVGKLSFFKPVLTRDYVKQLETDKVVADNASGFAELGVELETVEALIPAYLERYRKYGQFHEMQA